MIRPNRSIPSISEPVLNAVFVCAGGNCLIPRSHTDFADLPVRDYLLKQIDFMLKYDGFHTKS